MGPVVPTRHLGLNRIGLCLVLRRNAPLSALKGCYGLTMIAANHAAPEWTQGLCGE